LGGYLLLFPRARVDVLFIFIVFFKVFSIAAWIVLGLWFAVQLYNGATATDDGVAYLAHIGGYIAGLALTIPVFLRRGGMAFWAQNAGHPPHAAAEYPVSPTNIPRVRRL
jgi:membrane associated rhomboid family serine protease